MNLTELQIQLRSIEDHISTLQVEIEKMKPQPEVEKKADFEKITKLAAQYPLQNRFLAKEAAEIKKAYISCLSYITLADETKIYDKLLYLSRLAKGMDTTFSSEDILRMGMEVEQVYLEKACEELKALKYSFITDALILVNITEGATDATFSVIVDIAEIMECDKEELRVMAYVAKAVLTDDMDILHQLPVSNKNRWMGQFRQHIPVSWIESQRIVCGKICTEILKKADSSTLMQISWSFGTTSMVSKKPCVIKKRLQAGTIVKKGDELVVYEETTIKQKSIYAPCDGVVFFFEDKKYNSSKRETEKFVLVYVVSYFDDYTEFCEWHKKRN